RNRDLLNHRHSQHNAMRVEGQRKRVLTGQRQTKLALVERLRTRGIGRPNESHEWMRAKHVSSVRGNGIVDKPLLRHNVRLMRQAVVTGYDPKPGISISTLSYEYSPGYNVPEHAHGAEQVIYASRGVMEISAGQSFWLIPPQFAVWIPARVLHRIRMPGA